MRLKAVFSLVADNLRRHPFFIAAAMTGVALGVAIMVFFAGLASGVRSQIVDRLFESLPETRLKIMSSPMDLGFMNFAKPAFMRGSRLGENLLEEIAKQPGVEAVYGEMNVTFPIRVTGDLFGQRVGTDLIATGLDPKVIEKDIKDKGAFRKKKRGAVPVVISRNLFDLYNTTFAPMNSFPKIGERHLVGFRFDLQLGRSYLGGKSERGKIRKVQCEVVGLSNKAVAIGITVPLDYVRQWNEEFSAEGAFYSAIYADAKNPEKVEDLKKWAETKKYIVHTAKEGTPRQVARAIDFIAGLLMSVALLVLVLASINLAFLLSVMVHRRQVEIGLWRTVGATRLEVAAMIVFEAGFAGIVGWFAGILSGLGGAVLFDSILLSIDTGLPLNAESLFDFPVWIPLISLAFSLFATILGAIGPALWAARLEPVRSLRT